MAETELLMQFVVCDLCHSDKPEKLHYDLGWLGPELAALALVRCRQCGLIYLSPRLGPEEIDAYYTQDYEPYRPAIEDERWPFMRWMRRRKLRQRRQMIERFSGACAGRVLDVGCATGLFLHEMALAGWQTYGVEPSPLAAAYARRRFGLDVVEGVLEQASFPDRYFDVITYWDVLEHTLSPSNELARAARLLNPGGLLAINVPNWHSVERRLFGSYWNGFDPPRHLYTFTRPTLTALLEQNSFRVLDWVCFMPSYFSFIISLDHWLRSTAPAWAKPVRRVTNLPGARLMFEPVFAAGNWIKAGGVIAVFARKE